MWVPVYFLSFCFRFPFGAAIIIGSVLLSSTSGIFHNFPPCSEISLQSEGIKIFGTPSVTTAFVPVDRIHRTFGP